MQFILTDQHLDMLPGTIVYKLGIAQPETKQTRETHYLVSLTEDNKHNARDLYVISATKLESI